MFGQILGWIIKSKSIKVGGGVIGGSGLVVLLMGLHSDVTGKIEKQDVLQKEYVGLMLKPIETEIRYLKSEQKETKSMVRDIHNYLLKSKK